MAEQVTFLALVGRGIAVITSFFSSYINDNVLETNKDFEVLIIIAEIIAVWLIFREILIFVISKIWTFKKFDLWRKVVYSLIDFVSLLLIFLLFTVFFEKLRAVNTDVNIDMKENILIIYSSALLLYVVYVKVEKYSKI
jgi:hypothetical protein